MADRSDLKREPDQLREYGNGPERIQATMQAEIAVALHRVAEAIEAQNELLDGDEQ